LAWYAFFRAVGLAAVRNIEVRAEEKGTTWALVSQHSTTVAEASREEVERCLRIADAFAETAEWKDEIESTRHGLLDKAMALLEEAQRLLLRVD
jgi:delta 1-pyrroline-5-carboxylate dehydrogenase